VLGIIDLTEHDGRPYVALGTYEQATGVRDTATPTMGGHTQAGPHDGIAAGGRLRAGPRSRDP
jgi:hypothetical protein